MPEQVQRWATATATTTATATATQAAAALKGNLPHYGVRACKLRI